jgi:hypothetical protein
MDLIARSGTLHVVAEVWFRNSFDPVRATFGGSGEEVELRGLEPLALRVPL